MNIALFAFWFIAGWLLADWLKSKPRLWWFEEGAFFLFVIVVVIAIAVLTMVLVAIIYTLAGQGVIYE